MSWRHGQGPSEAGKKAGGAKSIKTPGAAAKLRPGGRPGEGPLQAEGIWVEVGRAPFTWGFSETILALGSRLFCVKARGGAALGDRVPVGRLVRPLFQEEHA